MPDTQFSLQTPGQLYKETQGDNFTRLLSYDAEGELTQDKETLDGAALWFNYGYDSLGRMTTLTYPETAAANRLKLDYTRDGNGNFDSVTDSNDDTAVSAGGRNSHIGRLHRVS